MSYRTLVVFIIYCLILPLTPLRAQSCSQNLVLGAQALEVRRDFPRGSGPVLIGAGLTSALLANYLGRRGFEVTIYEKRSDPRFLAVDEKRAIGMALTTRGMHALEQVGLHSMVLANSVSLKGRMIHQENGELLFQTYGDSPDHVHYSIERTTLSRALLDAAENQGAHIHFNHECEEFNADTGELQLRNLNGSFNLKCDTVIGTDGSSSTIRRALAVQKNFENVETPSDYAYKEIIIPAGPDGDYQMEPHAMHIWPRGKFVMIALPSPDKSFRAGLYLQRDAEPGFSTLTNIESVREFFATYFPDVLKMAPETPELFFRRPLGRLGTVNVYPWHLGSRALLMGDAAHGILPFFGQGANCGFEDCEIFANLFDESPNKNWGEIFLRFQQLRYQDTTAIAALALENQNEMSSTVRDPRYHFKRKVEAELKRRFPDRFIPRYEMIVFSRLSYHFAQERGRINSSIIEKLILDKNSMEEIDWNQAESLVNAELSLLKIQ